MGGEARLVPFLLVVTLGISGCLAPSTTREGIAPAVEKMVPSFDTSRGWSVPLTPPKYEILPALKVQVESFDKTPISLGIFLPKIEGCDWSESTLNESCRLPVVMDAGPYYADRVEKDKYRPPLVEWLVPRGYAVVQMSVRGTGESGGCMEFMSLNEQRDVDSMITWLAQQPWSNGNVGMMGRSYDGTTPLMGAALGNPHLKTIVPISGVTSQRDLMFKNGTSELRGPIMHSYVYWANYGLGIADGASDPTHRRERWNEQVCDEFLQGSTGGPLSTATGDASSKYWEDRDFKERILKNYNGSIWIVHGLEDWNVNPSQVVPWLKELQKSGKEVRAWLGVWAHAYPDRVDEHRNVRWDWAEATLRWFDYYLKGEGEKPWLGVEVEDSLFVWRAEKTFPPDDVIWKDVEVGLEGRLVQAQSGVTWEGKPLESDLRISGLVRLHLEVTPTTPTGGYLFAELYDVFPDGRAVRIGWGAIDLRHFEGGNTNGQTLVPGRAVLARMEFEPLDAHVASGHRLRIVLHKDGVEDILASPDPSPVLLGKGTLKLPTIERPSIVPSYSPPGLGNATSLVLGIRGAP